MPLDTTTDRSKLVWLFAAIAVIAVLGGLAMAGTANVRSSTTVNAKTANARRRSFRMAIPPFWSSLKVKAKL